MEKKVFPYFIRKLEWDRKEEVRCPLSGRYYVIQPEGENYRAFSADYGLLGEFPDRAGAEKEIEDFRNLLLIDQLCPDRAEGPMAKTEYYIMFMDAVRATIINNDPLEEKMKWIGYQLKTYDMGTYVDLSDRSRKFADSYRRSRREDLYACIAETADRAELVKRLLHYRDKI